GGGGGGGVGRGRMWRVGGKGGDVGGARGVVGGGGPPAVDRRGLAVLLGVQPAGAAGEADEGRVAAHQLRQVDVVVGERDRVRVGRQVLERLGQRGAAVRQGDLVGVRRGGLGAGVEMDAVGAAQGDHRL